MLNTVTRRPARLLSLVLAGLLLAGCQITEQSRQQEHSFRLQGELSGNADSRLLQPCSTDTPLTVAASQDWQQILDNCPNPSGPCFVDIQLTQNTSQTTRITDVYRIQHEGHSCNDTDFPHLLLRAFGNEPFWNIRLGTAGLILQQPGAEDLALPYIHEQPGEDQHFISSETGHAALELSISKQPCTDSMSGNWYPLTARLQWQGNNFSGCAHYGALLPQPTQHP